MHEQGAQLYAACGGSLVLAEAGLLDGQQATTHWSYAPLFRREFPNVALHEDRILVQSGAGHSMVCSGGASSWQDLALLLVAKYGGTEEAIRMSKLFLYQWHRDGQLPYASMIQNVDHGDAVILRCQTWIAQNYERPDIVAELVQPIRAAQAHLRPALQGSDRLFAAGLHPGAAHRGSQAVLETSAVPVEQSAARSDTRMPPRSAACSGAWPACRRATTAASSRCPDSPSAATRRLRRLPTPRQRLAPHAHAAL